MRGGQCWRRIKHLQGFAVSTLVDQFDQCVNVVHLLVPICRRSFLAGGGRGSRCDEEIDTVGNLTRLKAGPAGLSMDQSPRLP